MSINKSLTETINVLRVKAEAIRVSKQRYPESLRKEVSACVAMMRSEGANWDNCKDALGICKSTLHGWHQDASSETPSSAMVQVKIRPENNSAASQSLRIETPNGHQLTGFDLAEAAQLLRALG